MPWSIGNYPPAYQHQPLRLRQKAIEMANGLLRKGCDERMAIENGMKMAREYFLSQRFQMPSDTDLPAFP